MFFGGFGFATIGTSKDGREGREEEHGDEEESMEFWRLHCLIGFGTSKLEFYSMKKKGIYKV